MYSPLVSACKPVLLPCKCISWYLRSSRDPRILDTMEAQNQSWNQRSIFLQLRQHDLSCSRWNTVRPNTSGVACNQQKCSISLNPSSVWQIGIFVFHVSQVVLAPYIFERIQIHTQISSHGKGRCTKDRLVCHNQDMTKPKKHFLKHSCDHCLQQFQLFCISILVHRVFWRMVI